MRQLAAFAVVSLILAAGQAKAQNPKEACVDASERGQKFVDERKLLKARNAFLSCAQESCPGPVRRDCQTQLDELKKNLPSVIIRVKEKDGSDAARGTVSLDGVNIGVFDGQQLEMDPGTHKIRVDLPDGRVYERQIIVAAGEHGRAETFEASAPTSSPTQVAPKTEEHAATHWSTLRTVGLITIIVGGSAILVGGITELLALTFQSNAVNEQNKDPGCVTLSPPPDYNPNDNSTVCNSAVAYHQQALATQTVTYGLWIGGAAALVGGIVMFVVGGNVPAKSSSFRVTPLVSPTFAGLGLGGSF